MEKDKKMSALETSSNTDKATGSMAKNYFHPLESLVNKRTGCLGIALMPPVLKTNTLMSINLGVSYNQTISFNDYSLFGLPNGWSFGLSYIFNNKITIDGKESYTLHPESPSGMLYYEQKNLNLVYFSPSSYPELPYDKSKKYAYLLKFLDGRNQYFDSFGKLICYDDKNGNHQLFKYSADQKDVSNSKLIEVVSTEGKSVKISFTQDLITIDFPKNGQNDIKFSYKTIEDNLKLAEYIDPIGNSTSIEYKGGSIRADLISKISYPTGLTAEFSYATMEYFFADNKARVDVVSEISKSYDGKTRKVKYDYNAKGTHHNYLGFPKYNIVANKDSLLESNDNKYIYSTKVDNGITETIYNYNRLHLELDSTTTTLTNKLISKSTNLYFGQGTDHFFPSFNHLPPNYQYPKDQSTQYYNSAMKTRTFKTTSEYDHYCNKIKTTQYQEDNGILKVTKEIINTYDPNYGIALTKEIQDFMPDGTINQIPSVTKTIHTLTANKKYIVNSAIGRIEGSVFTAERNTTFKYDQEGRIISRLEAWSDSSDKEGVDQTGMTYAYVKNQQTNLFTKSIFDFKGNISMENYDMSSGFLVSKVDALGNKESYTFDNLGRMTSKTDKVGAKTKWKYTTANNKMEVTYQNGYITSEYYNGFGECIKKVDVPMLNGSERIIEQNAYNNLGQLEFKSGVLGKNSKLVYSYNDNGQKESQIDAEGNISTFNYDPVAQTKQTFLNGIKTREETYNHEKKLIHDMYYNLSESSATVSTSKQYNALSLHVGTEIGKSSGSNLKQVVEYDIFNKPIKQVAIGFDGIKKVNELTRDLLNNVIQSKRTLSHSATGVNSTNVSATQVYNAIGQLTEKITPLEKIKSYKYDAVGNIIQSSNHSHENVDYTYFGDKKMKSKSYKDIDGKSITINYKYDENLNLLTSIEQVNHEGNLDVIHYYYSIDGSLNKLIYPDGNFLEWHYNDCGFMTKMIDVGNQETNYSYDVYGRISEISNQNPDESVKIAYYSKNDKAYSGQIKSITYSNGIIINYTYSGYNLISNIKIINSGGKILLSVAYGYDNISGNIIEIQYRSEEEATLNYNISYKYNGINQLVSDEKKNSTGILILKTEYVYDVSGNIISKTVSETSKKSTNLYTYDQENKLIEIEADGSKVALKYDDNGNLIKDGLGNTYKYNVLCQLITFISKEGLKTEYIYYATGLRASKKTGNNEPIKYYYDKEKNPNIVNERQGEAIASYLMFNENRYIRTYSTTSTVSTEYLLQNAKDVLLVVDEDEKIVDVYKYAAYGNSSQKDVQHTIKANPFRYNKEYLDLESNLYYLRSRYYSPQLMSFISSDSIIIFNHYAYANGNPIMHVDPSGHLSAGAIAGIVVAAVVVVVASIIAAIFTFGVSAIAEAVGAVAGGIGGTVGGLIGGAEGATAGAATAAAVASSGAEGAMYGAAAGAVVGGYVGVGAGTGAVVGGIVGGAVGVGTAALEAGTAVAIGTGTGLTLGAYAGSTAGALIGETLAGTFGAAVGSTLGGTLGGFVGLSAGSAIGATLALGTEAGGIVGATASISVAAGTFVSEAAATSVTAITGFLGSVSEYIMPVIAFGAAE